MHKSHFQEQTENWDFCNTCQQCFTQCGVALTSTQSPQFQIWQSHLNDYVKLSTHTKMKGPATHISKTG